MWLVLAPLWIALVNVNSATAAEPIADQNGPVIGILAQLVRNPSTIKFGVFYVDASYVKTLQIAGMGIKTRNSVNIFMILSSVN